MLNNNNNATNKKKKTKKKKLKGTSMNFFLLNFIQRRHNIAYLENRVKNIHTHFGPRMKENEDMRKNRR